MKADQVLKLTNWQSRAVPMPISRLWGFRKPAPVSIECITGCLWVTLDRDPQDHILKAGESATFTGKGLVVTSVTQASIARIRARRGDRHADVLERILAPA